MRIYIIRHGETDWNVLGRLQGQTDTELNEKGIEIAKKTALGMARQGICFDRVLSSPLKRSRDTARLVLQGADVPIEVDARLREISFGEMEGARVTKEMRETPGNCYHDFFYDAEHYVQPKGAESVEDLCTRCHSFLEELKTKKEWMNENILISTHGAASRGLLLSIKNNKRKDFWDSGVPANCAVTIAELENNNWVLKEQDVLFYENF